MRRGYTVPDYSAPSPLAARNNVLACFYGQERVTFTEIARMLIMPDDQIRQALGELEQSEEICRLDGDAWQVGARWEPVGVC